jgi:hypothetical protein
LPIIIHVYIAHHGDNNNIGAYESPKEVIEDAQKRAKAASWTMPDCLGGGNESSPVWMRDYSSPPDKEPSNRKAQAMIGKVQFRQIIKV